MDFFGAHPHSAHASVTTVDEVDAVELDGPRPTVISSMAEIREQPRNAEWDTLMREAAARVNARR